MSRITDLLITNDPAWPWSTPGLGLPALALVALILSGLTVWTYVGVPGVTYRRFLAVLALRLAALLLAFLALLRPSLTSRDELQPPSLLLIAADDSKSMSIQDEWGNQSRWAYLQRQLRSCEPILQRLREDHNMTVVLARFADDVADYDPQGAPEGRRTYFAQMLQKLYERASGERHLRGLLVLSDGADNGTHLPPAQSLASQWRSLPCPIHTFALGKQSTTSKQSDLALVDIRPERPTEVYVKGELVVKGVLDATGFAGAAVRVHLFLDDKEVVAKDFTLDQSAGNEVTLKCSAPPQPGEVKVTLKVDPKEGEVTAANNEVSTYLTVKKEGLSVLLIDTPRFPEPQLICDALALDKRIRLFTVWLRGNQGLAPGQESLFQLDKQRYDVILLGDLTAAQLTNADPGALKAIERLVREKGVGLLMMGGDDSFGPSWQGTPIANLLPVRLNPAGRAEAEVGVAPTEFGKRHFVMQMADGDKANEAAWAKLEKLDGMTRLGDLKELANELARSGNGLPLLVGQDYGAGRTMAFAGDTTFRWRKDEEGVASHARFWKQVVLWLGKQEKGEGTVFINPETRRVGSGGKLGFTVGMQSQTGTEVKDPQLDVKVVGPDGAEVPVPLRAEKSGGSGSFWKTDLPGEYRIVAKGKGTDAAGQEVNGEASARFVVYQDDAERAVWRADHDFLKKLAAAGGGRFHEAKDLKPFLEDLEKQPAQQNRATVRMRPDWRNDRPFLLGFVALFVALLGSEWFLRRRWGMV